MKETIEKIKSQGYWRINIHPLNFIKDRILSLSQCEEIIKNSVVELRGWPYPTTHYNIPILRGQNWIQVIADYTDEIDVWRFYQSGQFSQFLALREDLMDLEPIKKMVIPAREINKPVLCLEYTVYLLTEIFEFLSRIAKQGIYKEGVEIKIELINTENRKLFIFDPMRAGFLEDYKTADSKLSYQKTLSEEEIIEKSKDSSLEAILWFIDRFGWKNPNVTSIKDMQQKLLERRL